MRRREFISLLGGAVAWPIASNAEEMRRVGVLMSVSEADPQGQARLSAFRQALRKLGWIENQNLSLEVRWGAGERDLFRRYAVELKGLAPDVILASGGVTMQALHQVTRDLPVVFASVLDPVGAGYVESLSHPGGNATGFTLFEYDIAAKWLERLKEAAPRIATVGVIRDAAATSGTAQLAAIRAVSPYLKVEILPIGTRSADEIEQGAKRCGEQSNGGLIIVAGASAFLYRDLIIKLAARYKLPAIYFERSFVLAGGLLSYGPEQVEPHRQAAAYVDRILKGEKPANLPVQIADTYEALVNVRTAKSLGLEIPPAVLAGASEVIE